MEAAFFDLDKTVIAKASMVAFGGTLRRAGMINRRLLARAAWSGLLFQAFGADEARMRRFRESALRVTRGWDQATVRTLVHDTLTDVIGPIVYEEALAEIRSHRAAGRRVYLVSASPEEIVVPLGVYLGVDESIASRPRIDADGRYTGEVDFYAYGPYKAEAVLEVAQREGLDLDASYAYSDSCTDLPLLQLVGHPVAVNPDRALLRTARAEGWEIRHFRHGVPLRERVPMPGPGPLGVGLAAAVGAVAGASFGWWALGRRLGAPEVAARPQRTVPARRAPSLRRTGTPRR